MSCHKWRRQAKDVQNLNRLQVNISAHLFSLHSYYKHSAFSLICLVFAPFVCLFWCLPKVYLTPFLDVPPITYLKVYLMFLRMFTRGERQQLSVRPSVRPVNLQSWKKWRHRVLFSPLLVSMHGLVRCGVSGRDGLRAWRGFSSYLSDGEYLGRVWEWVALSKECVGRAVFFHLCRK